MGFPPLPSWDAAHPVVVHFPIALLLTAPVLVVLSLAVPKLRRGVALAALAVMALGATGATLAVATGEEAEEAAERTPEGKAVAYLVHEHADAGETTRTVFLLLTAGYGALLIVPLVRKKELPRRADLALHAVFLAFYAFGCVELGWTGHLGGRLVHEKGVRARLAADPGAGVVPPAGVDRPGRRGEDGGK